MSSRSNAACSFDETKVPESTIDVWFDDVVALFQECGVEVSRVDAEACEVDVWSGDLLFRFSFRRNSLPTHVNVECLQCFEFGGFMGSDLIWPLKDVRHGLSCTCTWTNGPIKQNPSNGINFDKVLWLENFRPFLSDFRRVLEC